MSDLEWDVELVHSIREQRERERAAAPNLAGTLSRVLGRFSKMYGEKIHYALELIQNAEDARATSMSFLFEHDRLVVWNDGDPFTDRDVRDISDAALSHKRNKIGFFGVGFKAVFNISDRPQIVSGRFNFELTDFIYPRERTDLGFSEQLYDPARGSVVVLPYDRTKVESMDDLVRAVRELDPRLLLFLKHIQSIRFEVIRNSPSTSWTLARSGQNPVILTNTATQETTKWRIFRSAVTVPDDLEIPESKEGIARTSPVVAFPEPGTEVKSVRSAPLYCYLPTRRITGLPFLVNADFVPTSGRNDIERSEWNQWLLRHLGILAGRAVVKMAKDPESAMGLLEFVPLVEEVTDDQIQPIVAEMHHVLGKARIVPSRSGGLIAPRSTVLGTFKLATLLEKRDLRKLMRKPADFPNKALRNRDLAVVRQLGAKQMGTEEVLEVAHRGDHYPKREALWYLRLYDYFADAFEADVRNGFFSSTDVTKALWAKVMDTRVLLLRDGSLVPPRILQKGRIACYPQREVKAEELETLFADRRIVFLHGDLQEASVLRRAAEPQDVARMKERVKEFLKSAFGVIIYLQINHVVDKVLLPMFKSGEVTRYSKREVLAFTDFIRQNLPRYVQLYRKSHYSSEGAYDGLRKSLAVLAYRRRDRTASRALAPYWSAYLGRPYLQDRRLQRLLGPYGAPFVSPAYSKKHPATPKRVLGWRDFFLEMGVWDTLALHPLASYKISWEDAKRRFGDGVYSTREYVVSGDVESPDLGKLLSEAQSPPSGFDMRCELWRVLDTGWSRHRPHLECTLQYFYRTEVKARGPTRFATEIKTSAWIPTLNGKFAAPADVLQNSEENRLLLGRSGHYTRLVAKKQFLEDLGVRLQPSSEEVARELRRLRKDPSTRGKSFRPRMSAIYSFISAHLPEDPDAAAELRRIFESESLVYLPRKDKQWWAPSELLWEDSTEVFGRFRGYASLYYGGECRPLFQFLGTPDRPRIPDIISVLRDLSRKRDFGERWLGDVRVQLRSIYLHLEQLLNAPVDEPTSRIVESFRSDGRLLSEGGRFEPVATLCFIDNPRLHSLFRDAVKVVYIPFNPSSIPRTLRQLGLVSLSSRVKRRIDARHPRPMEPATLQRLRESIEAAFRFISQNQPSVLMGQGIEIRERLKQFHANRVHSIAIRFQLQDAAGNVLGKDRQRTGAYLDDSRWRLLQTVDAGEAEVAQELSTLFGGGQSSAYPILLRLLEAVEDEDEFQRRVRDYGLEPVAEERVDSPVEVLTEASKAEMGIDPERQGVASESQEAEAVPETAASTVEGSTTTGSPSHAHQDELVDLNGLTSFDVREVPPETSTQTSVIVRVTGSKHQRARNTARLPPPIPSGGGASTAREKAIAEHIAFRFENLSDRHPRYVPQDEQDQEGCDILSDGRVIEVKGLIDGEGSFTLQQSQYKRAEKDGGSYYIYVVSNLRRGQRPTISIIRDPVNCGKLVFERPRHWKVLEWKGAVKVQVHVGAEGADGQSSS